MDLHKSIGIGENYHRSFETWISSDIAAPFHLSFANKKVRHFFVLKDYQWPAAWQKKSKTNVYSSTVISSKYTCDQIRRCFHDLIHSKFFSISLTMTIVPNYRVRGYGV